ncbi:MAG: lipoprotein-releasing ABC transporter permease subunit LolC [Candidatus Malihini olakiniferum]
MYQPVALCIGLRYMSRRASDRFGRFVFFLSAIGITLGVMALVTVLSVMNGFEWELEESILGLMPQAVVTTENGLIDPQALPASSLSTMKGITRIAPITTGEVVMQSAHSVAVGVMLGIQPDEPEPLSRYLRSAKLTQLQPGKYQLILGDQLASQLKVKHGEKLRIMVTRASQLTPIGRIPSQRLFTVAGTFSADSEVDGYQILVNQQDASRLMHYPVGYITGWRLWLENPLDINAFSRQPIPDMLVLKDWREQKGELFQAVRMEKKMMELLLILIVVVAAFNIVTSLGLLVMKKKGEVAILKTQGLTRCQIMAVFMVHGGIAGVIGALLGAFLGTLLASQLNAVIPMLGLLLDYATLPIRIDAMQVVTIALVAMIIAILSTIYPSWHAAIAHPAESLRYE